METLTDALHQIIIRCPDLLGVATGALKAVRAGSPVADQRAQHTIDAALRHYGTEFTPAERATLVALLDPVEDSGDTRRTVNLQIRVTSSEREQLHADAATAGQTVSDYLRGLLGLPLR